VDVVRDRAFPVPAIEFTRIPPAAESGPDKLDIIQGARNRRSPRRADRSGCTHHVPFLVSAAAGGISCLSGPFNSSLEKWLLGLVLMVSGSALTAGFLTPIAVLPGGVLFPWHRAFLVSHAFRGLA
jgi:hypothetical protein